MNTNKRATLSVIIICKNEAQHIEACLRSVGFADEIIVLDSGSDDQTVALAKRYTDKIFINTDWQGFGIQKNRALGHASGDWILSIDCDERVDAVLQKQIQLHIANHPNLDVAARFPRLNYFCGKPVRYGLWSPDYVFRLAPRKMARFNDVAVHETLQYSGKITTLSAKLLHYSYEDFDQYLKKMNHYSSEWAFDPANTRKSSILKAITRGFWAFFRAYFLRAGFLDGKLGLVLGLSSGHGVFYKYVKLHFKNTAAPTDQSR